MVRLAHHARNLPFNRCAPFKSFNRLPEPGQTWRYSTGFPGENTTTVNRTGSKELGARIKGLSAKS
jgi:hypothetical protein